MLISNPKGHPRPGLLETHNQTTTLDLTIKVSTSGSRCMLKSTWCGAPQAMLKSTWYSDAPCAENQRGAAVNIDIRHWHSTLAFDIDIGIQQLALSIGSQHRHSAAAFNIGIQHCHSAVNLTVSSLLFTGVVRTLTLKCPIPNIFHCFCSLRPSLT